MNSDEGIMMRKTVDFMIVGFGRCGTTTLFEHLRRHPQIFIPRYKECPFIAGETKTEYMRRHFPKDYKGKIIGAITPQWMEYPKLFNEWFPDAKVLMITRNPEDRTISHVRMLEVHGEEVDLNHIKKISDYKYWKKKWKKHGDLFTTDLEILKDMPEICFDSICEYIEVDYFTPGSLGKVYNVGYDKMNPIMKFLKRLPIRHYIPKSIKNRIWRFLEK